MSLESFLEEGRRRREKQKAEEQAAKELEISSRDTSVSHQFGQGFKETASLGYLPGAPKPPEGLPLSGTIARHAGSLAGFVPSAVALGMGGTALGLSGLAAEAIGGFAYGVLENQGETPDPDAPPDPDAFGKAVEARIKTGLETAALFGAGHVILKGAKALFKGAPKGAPKVAGEVTTEEAGPAWSSAFPREFNLNVSPFSTPAEFKAYKIFEEGMKPGGLKAPSAPPSGLPQGEMMEAFLHAKKIQDTTRAGKMEARLADETAEVSATITHSNLNPNGELDPFSATMPEKLIKTEVIASIADLETAKAVGTWDRMVGSWGKDFLKPYSKEANPYFEKALPIAEVDPELGWKQMVVDSGLYNIGETPSMISEIKTAIPQLEVQKALQESIEESVKKYGLTSEQLQVASQVPEPINYFMGKLGLNFEDASKLASSFSKRAETSLDIKDLQRPKFEGLNAPQVVPSWEQARKRNYTADEVFDLFHNMPFKQTSAFKHRLIERNLQAPGDEPMFKFTPDGYGFLKEWNPEGLSGAQPTFISKKGLGAIRAKGHSSYSFTPEELKKDLKFKVPRQRALDQGWIRPAVVKGKEIPGEFQLTEDGASFLAGSRKTDQTLRLWDLKSGLRTVPEDEAGILERRLAHKDNELRFRDLWEEMDGWKKGCPD